MTTTTTLAARIHGHLRRFPGLTAWQIHLALHEPVNAVALALWDMETSGQAQHADAPRTPADTHPALRWWAT